ncbi:NADPH-dependent FMN reductase [Legionella sp. km772]|uniref:NADPH-dependent FMN reductase n=1 Tax=Legionella sp. km772 TaxID=2498111 RepID=UPI000F8E9B31|nr:NAD(P)H-dependent oxidoreductase [Legionella sp. km772]RUR13815.1 NADPH-dependent oxidoreductase [Legionella sp. km772]
MSKKVAVIIGSLRKDSLNRKVAKALISLAPREMHTEIIEIRDLPLYNQDLDDEHRAPDAWLNFRQQVKRCEGVLFVTPEYNRSIPAPLKNAVDVGSRPYGDSIWNAKPGAIISVSPGAIGGFGASQHLRQSLSCLNIPLLPQPEAYIGQAGSLFNEQDELIKEDTQKFFKGFMEGFFNWINLNTAK